MNTIIDKKALSSQTIEMHIHAPEIAKKAEPGQFIIIRIDEKGERIPLTIADWDNQKIVIVFQIVGMTTRSLARLDKGNTIMDICGPLGNPYKTTTKGTVVLIGGGCGAAALLVKARYLKDKGNRVLSVIGARSKDLLVWPRQIEKYSEKVLITTDDGSAGIKGKVTDALKKIIEQDNIDEIVAIGPVIMMKHVSLLAKQHKIKTTVSLNPIMIDGIGMCGSCRVLIDGKTRFSCVDGPEFDGHSVDWDNLLSRNLSYAAQEHECMCGTQQQATQDIIKR